MIDKILELIFPRKCGFCNILINEDYACKKCKKNLEYIWVDNTLNKVKDKYFDILISSYFYKGIIRTKILEFKFNNKKYLYKALSEKLLKDLQSISSEIDCVIAVPISLSRYFERGYNQSALIAKFIANNLQKPLYKFILVKSKNNSKQSELGIKDRLINVTNAYKILNKKKIFRKNILLIDDIYTTGATVNECSKILKQNGANKIFVATIAKAEFNKYNIEEAKKKQTKEDVRWTN